MRDTPHRTITELEDRLRRANEVIESSAPSYTLAELKELARECANESNVTSDDRTIMLLAFSRFLAWLARREREVGDGRGL